MSTIRNDFSDMPFFSIVIPCFNSSETISIPLASILNQSYKDYEVILVDDHSKDFDVLTMRVTEFIDKGMNIKVFRHERNLNGASARNTGIDASSGLYIAFLDSDDEWSEDKLETFRRRIELEGADKVFYSQVKVVDEDGKVQSIRPEIEFSEGDMSEYLFLMGGFIQTSSIVMSLTNAKKVRFDERFTRHQDYDLCLRAKAMGLQFVFIRSALTTYHSPGKKFHSKNEDVEYCTWWVREMSQYMSNDGYYGYLFFSLTNRMIQARFFRAAALNAVKSFYKLGFGGIWKARRKLFFILNLS